MSNQKTFLLQAEFLQTNCRSELLDAKTILHDLELCSMKNLVGGKLSRTKMYDAKADIWCPQVRQILLECMSKKKITVPVPATEKDLNEWYMRYVRPLMHQHYSSERRELAAKTDESSPTPMIAAAGLILAVVLVCIFFKCCNGDSGQDTNDERPLLTLSLSDNSVGIPSFCFSFCYIFLPVN